MKRVRGSPGYTFDPSPEGKRRRLEIGAANQFLIRGGFKPMPKRQIQSVAVRQFVPRSPGGQIVADNHYFDCEKANVAMQVGTTDWAGGELDGQTGATLELLCLFAPTQGDDITQRTGRKTFLKKIRIKGTIIVPAQTAQTTLDTPAKVRLVLYCDQQTNSTQSQAEQVLASGNASGPLNFFQSTLNFGRFKVYKDKTFIIGPITSVNNTGAAGGIVQGANKRDFKLTANVNMWVNYNATNGGTVADVIDNSFHLIGLTDGATTAPEISYKCRCTFLP